MTREPLGRIRGWLHEADERLHQMMPATSDFRREFEDVRTEWSKDHPALFKKFSDAEEASAGTRDVGRHPAHGDESQAPASEGGGRRLPDGEDAGRGAIRGGAGAGGAIPLMLDSRSATGARARVRNGARRAFGHLLSGIPELPIDEIDLYVASGTLLIVCVVHGNRLYSLAGLLDIYDVVHLPEPVRINALGSDAH